MTTAASTFPNTARGAAEEYVNRQSTSSAGLLAPALVGSIMCGPAPGPDLTILPQRASAHVDSKWSATLDIKQSVFQYPKRPLLAKGVARVERNFIQMINGDNRRLSLANVTAAGSDLPNRCVLHGVEGVGKTSFACSAPRPIFLMTRGETGLDTLINAGQVPPIPHFPELTTWQDLLGAVEALIAEPHEFRTLVIDTLNGAERLCHEKVCQRDFGGNWGRDGFTAFMTGFEVALADWRVLLDALDQLREKRRMSILALAHTRISTFRNPEGADYDRFTVDLHHKTWSLTHKWSDLVIFANFVAHIDTKKQDTKGKAKGGSRRVLFTTRTAAFDAKNRHGLPDQIDCGHSAAEAWAHFAAALQAGKQQLQTGSAEGQQAITSTPITRGE
jgi:hypothetical protein